MVREFELNNCLEEIFSTNKFKVKNLIPDASARKYYRVFVDEKTFILMDSNNDPSLEKFIKISEYLSTCGVSVPRIFEKDLDKRFLLLSDFGDDLYLNVLTNNNSDHLYSLALSSLAKIQKKDLTKFFLNFANFSDAFISNQLNVFTEWYLKKHKGFELSVLDLKFINKLSKWFAKIFANMPQAFVHLDYHSRNLLVLKENSPGIIDFQDAVIGPTVYDLASLFQDAYIFWPRQKVETWLQEYNALLIGTNLAYKNMSDLYRDFDFVAVQRHLKNLGIFARLYHRDKKEKYLKDIPLLLEYIKSICDKYYELKDLKAFLNEKSLFIQNSFSRVG